MAERDSRPGRGADRYDNAGGAVPAYDPFRNLPQDLRDQLFTLRDRWSDKVEAEDRARALSAECKRLIAVLRTHGVSMRRLSTLLGVSYARIQQIDREVRGLPRQGPPAQPRDGDGRWRRRASEPGPGSESGATDTPGSVATDTGHPSTLKPKLRRVKDLP